MNREQRILEEAEKTLSAFDNLPKLEANPFLATRLHARLAEEGVSWGQAALRSPWLKPAALALFILLNIFTIVELLNAREPTTVREQLVSALRQEYNSNQQGY
jgi:hypothetical protein